MNRGPPNFARQAYATGGPLANGAVVRVTVNRSNQTIEFAINGVDRGVAYQGVFSPNDVLRPCILVNDRGVSVRLMPEVEVE